MKQVLVRIGSLLMLSLFLSYYISTTSFYHTHRYYWGCITHSHFYHLFGSKGNPVNHQHTTDQFQTIAFLSHIVFACVVAAVVAFKAVVVRLVILPVRRYVSHTRLIHSPLRAPPLSLFACSDAMSRA
jgi:hypothetical protein